MSVPAAPDIPLDVAAARRRSLRTMKGIALGALLLAAAIYVATLGREGGWAYLHAAAEAAMVGALADWFAVTALFRRPLGLPIPHTAIIPNRKDQIGESLQEFVAGNFLTEAVVREQVANAQVTRRVGEWLGEPANVDRVVHEGATALGGALRVMKDEHVAPILHNLLMTHVAQRSWSPVVGEVLGRVVEEGGHRRLVDLGVSNLLQWLRDNPDRVKIVVRAQAPNWSPGWIDDLVANRVYETAVNWVQDISRNPQHAVRQTVDDFVLDFSRQLREDPGAIANFDGFVMGVAERAELGQAIESLWAAIRDGLESAVSDPQSQLRLRAKEALTDVGQRLLTDQKFADRLDAYLQDGVAYVVNTYKHELVGVISDTVSRWDGHETARLIEEHVGRDLQFIRLNGTLVGALAGLAIHSIAQALG